MKRGDISDRGAGVGAEKGDAARVEAGAGAAAGDIDRDQEAVNAGEGQDPAIAVGPALKTNGPALAGPGPEIAGAGLDLEREEDPGPDPRGPATEAGLDLGGVTPGASPDLRMRRRKKLVKKPNPTGSKRLSHLLWWSSQKLPQNRL